MVNRTPPTCDVAPNDDEICVRASRAGCDGEISTCKKSFIHAHFFSIAIFLARAVAFAFVVRVSID